MTTLSINSFPSISKFLRFLMFLSLCSAATTVSFCLAEETKTVTFTLGFNELSFLNRDMKRVVEQGTFTIMLGGNSVDLTEAKLNVVDR